ncbi:hypothetical protein [Heliorestis convoluta]|uniref:Uncharacterized protein n=1 Tax=Heliorestis convoluta TaxID=356322 RepID=A0A5Q2N5Q9_9FIRM|nr:hypothetical protein [Heliorestis convoluta]QGG47580.1 hypothetical protein FTV88_1433 [Heliorestis convoluta]
MKKLIIVIATLFLVFSVAGAASAATADSTVTFRTESAAVGMSVGDVDVGVVKFGDFETGTIGLTFTNIAIDYNLKASVEPGDPNDWGELGLTLITDDSIPLAGQVAINFATQQSAGSPRVVTTIAEGTTSRNIDFELTLGPRGSVPYDTEFDIKVDWELQPVNF